MNLGDRSQIKKVSIILPTYNRAHLLRDCIDNVLKQSYPNFEVIIVNDCSTDNTSELLQNQVYLTDPRITIITNPQNQGTPRSLNVGFAVAKGDYLTWTSDDNFMHTDFCSEFIKRFDSEDELDYLYCDYVLFDKDIHHRKNRVYRPLYKNKIDFLVSFGGSAGFMWTRKVQDALKSFDTDLFGIEDWDFLLRIIFNDFKFGKIDRALYYYRIHKGSLTSQLLKTPKYLQLHHQVCDKMLRTFGDFFNNYSDQSDFREQISKGTNKEVVNYLLSNLSIKTSK